MSRLPCRGIEVSEAGLGDSGEHEAADYAHLELRPVGEVEIDFVVDASIRKHFMFRVFASNELVTIPRLCKSYQALGRSYYYR